MGKAPSPKNIFQLYAEQGRLVVKHHELELYRSAEYYNLNENKYQFYLQRLYSQGLLIDIGIGGIGKEPFEMMNITEFGMEFINFIKRSD